MARPRNYLALKEGITGSGLGRLVAEQDQELTDYYVNPARYVDRALNVNDPAIYFVGPKGVGKSAILQMVRLTRAADSNRIINIAPTDLAFSALANIDAVTPLLEDVHKHQWLFRSLWDYVLALEIITRELPSENQIVAWVKSLFREKHENEARKLLKISIDDDGRLRESWSMRFLSILKEIELSGKSAGIDVTGKAKLDWDALSTGGQFGILSLINSVAKTMSTLLRHPYFILIDDLDLDWRDTQTQNSLLAAMFTSLRNFSKAPNLKCVVAIQRRIYDRLPIEHKDKFHDSICDVSWDADSVKEMIERRVRHRLLNSGSPVWGGVFPVNGFARIWESISGRPREAIRLASICIDEARGQGHLAVEEADMVQAIRRLSKERVGDLGSEWADKYPGLDALVRRFSGWKKEFQLRSLREFAEAAALEVMCDLGKSVPNRWAGGFGEDHIGLAKILLECNVLLFKQSRTDEPTIYDSSFHHELSDDDWVAIQPMYAPGLGLVGA